LPIFGTCLNHGDYWRLHSSGLPVSGCRDNQGCPHRNLQGWYLLHLRLHPAQLLLAHFGVHHPSWQVLRISCLLLSSQHTKPLPAGLSSPVPPLQGWKSLLIGKLQSLHQVSLHMNPYPIAPAPERQHQLHLHSSPPGGPSTRG
jgi:hypothetical protein